MSERKAITGRDEVLVRLWDKDFNLLHSQLGQGDEFPDLIVTVDDVDGTRKSGRVHSVKVLWNTP